MAVKAILFDFWGTLVENGVFPSPVKQVKRILRIKEQFPEYIVKFEEVFMLRTYENLAEAFEKVAEEFRVHPKHYQIEKLVGIWNSNRLLARLFPDTAESLKDLKKDYKIGLISNTDCFSVRPLIEKFRIGEFFDAIKLSYETGLLKSNKKVFEDTLNEIGVSKDDAVMVGDSIQSDIRGAESAGIRGILIDRKNRQNFHDKILSLKELRSKIEG